MKTPTLSLFALLLAACGGAGDPPAAPSPQSACAPAATSPGWQLVLAPDRVRFPVQMDTHAAYAIYSFQASAATALRIDGEFPYAAFLSLTTYDADGLLYDALLDKDIVPQAGSTNPFVPGAFVNAPNRGYRAFVLSADGPARPNSLRMPPLPPGAATAPVTLVLRVYLPRPGANRCGDVPLPTISAVAVEDLATPRPAPPQAVAGSTPQFGSFGGVPAPPAPDDGVIRFYRPPVSMVPFADGSGRLLPGDCTGYLMASLDPARIAVVDIEQLPSDFDNTATDATTRFGETQVRYLSMGSYGPSVVPPLGSPLPGNIAGPELRRLPGGGARFVVVPADVTGTRLAAVVERARALGANVLPMAEAGPVASPFLIYRNKVAAAGFPGSIANVACYPSAATFDTAPPSYAASATNMGPYAPTGATCGIDDFVTGRCGGAR